VRSYLWRDNVLVPPNPARVSRHRDPMVLYGFPCLLLVNMSRNVVFRNWWKLKAIDSLESSTVNHETPFEERERIIYILIGISEIEDMLDPFNKNVNPWEMNGIFG
jgi:hypothetical protein